MIGPKNLSTIRLEIRHALIAVSNDPMRWLEERMAAERPVSKQTGESEVLLSLQRILAPVTTKKSRKPRVGTKK